MQGPGHIQVEPAHSATRVGFGKFQGLHGLSKEVTHGIVAFAEEKLDMISGMRSRLSSHCTALHGLHFMALHSK